MRAGAVCKPPSPIGRGCRSGCPHGYREAESIHAAGNCSCWRPELFGSHLWCRLAPRCWWCSYSRWNGESGVSRLFHLSLHLSADPQIHGDCGTERNGNGKRKVRLRQWMKNILYTEVTCTRILNHNGSEESLQRMHAWVISTHGN